MEKLKMHTSDLAEENYRKLAALFPNAVTETVDEDGNVVRGIDKDVLMQEINAKVVDDGQERYQFTWPDKRKKVVLANLPIAKTLRLNQEKSVGRDGTPGGIDSENIYIEGDNLEALKLLQETYLGKVRMIYIDPPYNTGRDFIYSDKFSIDSENYLGISGQQDEQGNQLVQNAETNGKFHTDWLNMMYPRLRFARDLLSDDGVIFISIDDNEVDELKKICSEIFGASNVVGCAGRITKKSNNKGDFWAPNFDYIITCVKNRDLAIEFTGGANTKSYNLVEDEGPRKGEKYQLVRLYMSSLQNRNPEQRFWIDCPDGSKIIPPGTTFPPERPNLGDGIWRWSRKTFEENKDKIVIKQVKSSNLLDQNKQPAKWNVFTKTYLNDVLAKSTAKPNSFIENYINQMASHELNDLGIPFDYAKPSALIKYLMEVAQLKSDDIVLDFFSGSASTAHAMFLQELGKDDRYQFILVQLPEPCDPKRDAYKDGYETLCDIGEGRIRRAGDKIKTELEESNRQLKLGEGPKQLPDIGFRVFELDESGIEKPEPGQLLFDVVKPDRSDMDIVFEMMLKWGLELTLPVEKSEAAGYPIWSVACDELVCCMSRGLTIEALEAIADMEPRRVLILDSVLDDTLKLNAVQIFKHAGERMGCEIELRTV